MAWMHLSKWLNEKRDMETSSRLIPLVDDLTHILVEVRKNKLHYTDQNHWVVKPGPVQPAVSTKPIVRGYDSRDLFWEDALLRIDELKRQIAADLKKEE